MGLMNLLTLVGDHYGVKFEKLAGDTDIRTYRTYFGSKYERKIDVILTLKKGTLVYTHEFDLDTKPFSVRLYFENVKDVDDLNKFFNAVDKIAEIK